MKAGVKNNRTPDQHIFQANIYNEKLVVTAEYNQTSSHA